MSAQERLEGLRLQADAVERLSALPGISGIGIEQQLGRERDAAGSSWSAKLDTLRK
jgi:hypothetical protein